MFLRLQTLRLDPWRTFSSVSRRIATYDFKDFIGFAKLQDLAIVLEYEMGSYFEACPEFASETSANLRLIILHPPLQSQLSHCYTDTVS